jgi:hypothetical protein
MKVALTLFAALSVVGATPAAATSGKSGYLKYDDYGGSPYTVTYDNRSLIVGGDRGFFASIGIRQWSFFFRVSHLLCSPVVSACSANSQTTCPY